MFINITVNVNGSNLLLHIQHIFRFVFISEHRSYSFWLNIGNFHRNPFRSNASTVISLFVCVRTCGEMPKVQKTDRTKKIEHTIKSKRKMEKGNNAFECTQYAAAIETPNMQQQQQKRIYGT